MRFFSSIIAILLLVSSVYSNGDFSTFNVGICTRRDTTTVITLQQSVDQWNSLLSGDQANCWFCPSGIDCTSIIDGCRGRRCSSSELIVSSSNQISCMSSTTTTNAINTAPILTNNIGVARNDFSSYDARFDQTRVMNNQLVAPIQNYGYGVAPVVRAPIYNAPYYGSAWNNNMMYNDYSRYDSRVVDTDYTRYNSLVAPVQTYGYGAPVIRAPIYNAPYYGSAWNNNLMYNDYSRYDSRYDARYDTRYNSLVAPVQSYGYGAVPIVGNSWNAAPIIRTAPSYGSNINVVDNSYGNDIVRDASYGGVGDNYAKAY